MYIYVTDCIFTFHFRSVGSLFAVGVWVLSLPGLHGFLGVDGRNELGEGRKGVAHVAGRDAVDAPAREPPYEPPNR